MKAWEQLYTIHGSGTKEQYEKAFKNYAKEAFRGNEEEADKQLLSIPDFMANAILQVHM